MVDLFEKYQVVVESTPNAIVIANEIGRIVLVNQQTENLFGYQREELLGQPIEILLPDRYKKAHPGHRASFTAHPSARPMGTGRDLFALHKKGTEIPVEIGLNPFQTPDGHFVLAAIVDITKRKQAEEIAIKSQERFRHMVENFPAGAVHVEGNTILFNKAVENMTGFLNSEVQTLDDWFKKLYGKECVKVRSYYEEDKKSGFPVPRTVALKRKDGETRFIEFAAYRDEKVEVWLLHDVTEKRRLEKMILEVTKKEQQRIGEELHEGLAQHLTLTAIAGKLLGNKISKGSKALARENSKVVNMINQAIAQTRELAQGLYSVDTQHEGLYGALKKFAADTQKMCEIQCVLRCDRHLQVRDSEVASHLYRIVRESVSNAIKHGKTKKIIISLKTKDKETMELKITNNGIKFKCPKPGYEGMGLKIMQSRAKIIGAEVTITAKHKGGAVVTCVFSNH